jgi:hypothetical protein
MALPVSSEMNCNWLVERAHVVPITFGFGTTDEDAEQIYNYRTWTIEKRMSSSGVRKYAREAGSHQALKGVNSERSRKTTAGNFLLAILKRGSVRKVSCHVHVSYQQVSRSRRADDTWRRAHDGGGDVSKGAAELEDSEWN